jgi:lipoate-protein ligase A
MHILPVRTAGAAENMAVDFLLLQRYPQPAAARFRHYDWRSPAFTFGYSQKIAWVRAQLPEGGPFDLCRRPTGGGVVDHREDWTYCLVIPRGHPLEEMRASQSYRAVHEALAGSLQVQGVPVAVKTVRDDEGHLPGVCFETVEIYDVVHASTQAKLAGAAQKRNKHGLLFQGSIWRPACGMAVDWERFHDDFAARLATALGLAAEPTPWPDLNEEEVGSIVDHYASAEWVAYR